MQAGPMTLDIHIRFPEGLDPNDAENKVAIQAFQFAATQALRFGATLVTIETATKAGDTRAVLDAVAQARGEAPSDVDALRAKLERWEAIGRELLGWIAWEEGGCSPTAAEGYNAEPALLKMDVRHCVEMWKRRCDVLDATWNGRCKILSDAVRFAHMEEASLTDRTLPGWGPGDAPVAEPDAAAVRKALMP